MSKNVLTVGDESFDREVLGAEVPVLVDFGATWCGPCKKLVPIVEGIAADHAGTLKVVSVDIDDAPKVAARYGVRAVPTVLAFRGGEKIGQRVGLTTRDKLLELVSAG